MRRRVRPRRTLVTVHPTGGRRTRGKVTPCPRSIEVGQPTAEDAAGTLVLPAASNSTPTPAPVRAPPAKRRRRAPDNTAKEAFDSLFSREQGPHAAILHSASGAQAGLAPSANMPPDDSPAPAAAGVPRPSEDPIPFVNACIDLGPNRAIPTVGVSPPEEGPLHVSDIPAAQRLLAASQARLAKYQARPSAPPTGAQLFNISAACDAVERAQRALQRALGLATPAQPAHLQGPGGH